jgi:helix-turn-helix protein
VSLIVTYERGRRRGPSGVPIPADPDPLLTMAQAANMLAVSKRTMVRWVARENQGVLDVSPTGSERRQLRIRLSAIRRLQRKMTI